MIYHLLKISQRENFTRFPFLIFFIDIAQNPFSCGDFGVNARISLDFLRPLFLFHCVIYDAASDGCSFRFCRIDNEGDWSRSRLLEWAHRRHSSCVLNFFDL
jgi:hypothetical protein